MRATANPKKLCDYIVDNKTATFTLTGKDMDLEFAIDLFSDIICDMPFQYMTMQEAESILSEIIPEHDVFIEKDNTDPLDHEYHAYIKGHKFELSFDFNVADLTDSQDEDGDYNA